MITLEQLKQQHGRVRLMLLISLVFFLIGLFALVSHWDSAIPIVLAACVFRLVGVGLVRRRYNAAWMQASVTAAARRQLAELRYAAMETVPSDILSQLGCTPPTPLLPDTQLHHVLHGILEGCALRVGEAAFVHAKEGRNSLNSQALSGTLLTAEQALPETESWVLLWHRPFDGLVPLSEYYSRLTSLETPAPMRQTDAACFQTGGDALCLAKAAAVLAPFCREPGVALSARNGCLTLFLPGSFYAQKPDITKIPDEELLNGGAIVGVEVMKKLCRALRAPERKA